MTLGDIATKARALTHTDTTSYTDANLLIDLNIWYEKCVSMILESMDEAYFDDPRRGAGGSAGSALNYPVQTTPLIASQRDYPIAVSEKFLKLKRVDVTYDGSHWYRADPLDSGSFPFGMGSDTEIDANFIREAPSYSIKFNSIWIYPLATASDVANGAKIQTEWERNVIAFTTADYTSVLTDSTQVPGLDEPFHPMLCLGAAYEKAISDLLPQKDDFLRELSDWEMRLRQHYGRKELDRTLQLEAHQDMNEYR